MSEEETDATSVEVVCEVAQRHLTRVKKLLKKWEEKQDIYEARLKTHPESESLQIASAKTRKQVEELRTEKIKLETASDIMECQK